MNSITTILIVEDDDRIRNYIKTVLVSCGYNALETNKQQTALSLLASHKPDLLLLDLGLPDGDG